MTKETVVYETKYDETTVEMDVDFLISHSIDEVSEKVKTLVDENKHSTLIAIKMRNKAMKMNFGRKAIEQRKNFGAVGYRWILERPKN